jgi:hypothetical protein
MPFGDSGVMEGEKRREITAAELGRSFRASI